ncbi:MAG: hypothetical protein FFODKBPE_00649 [Candidatus Argoarchaeum ethanivorans]|uniref:Uncharacterized protein n=1 Tax=Candidatus Argoarchaeum ethanivorans TaxID=2608793 RepID=A0A811THE8_9EURY|nr:MAG: hypothetical protein FFODKBPE_00649 [Candidatus Argoarchaeum ethanivorans]
MIEGMNSNATIALEIAVGSRQFDAWRSYHSTELYNFVVQKYW